MAEAMCYLEPSGRPPAPMVQRLMIDCSGDVVCVDPVVHVMPGIGSDGVVTVGSVKVGRVSVGSDGMVTAGGTALVLDVGVDDGGKVGAVVEVGPVVEVEVVLVDDVAGGGSGTVPRWFAAPPPTVTGLVLPPV